MKYIIQCYDCLTKDKYRKELDISMEDKLEDISKKFFDNKPLVLASKDPNSIVLSLEYILDDNMKFCWDLSIIDANFKEITQCYPNLNEQLIFIVNLGGIGCAGGPWWGTDFLEKINEYWQEHPFEVQFLLWTIPFIGKKLLFFIKKKTKRYLSTLKCCKESSYTNSINSREIWRLEDLKKAIHCNEVEVILFIMYYLGYSYDKEFELFEKIIDDTPVNKKDN